MKKSLFLVGLVFFLNVPGVFAQPTIDCTKSSLGLDFTGAAEDGSPLLIETISVHFEIGEGMTGTPASPHFTRKGARVSISIGDICSFVKGFYGTLILVIPGKLKNGKWSSARVPLTVRNPQ